MPRQTQLYFIAGLLAALVLVPLVALAATTAPAADTQQSETP